MSELEDLPTVELPCAKPAVIADLPLPVLDFVDTADLKINRLYQRDFRSPASLRSIRKKYEGWDWLKCPPLIVALVTDGIEIIDGQHRAIAAKMLGIRRLPCYIVDGTTLQERAYAFVSHARDRLPVTPGQVWHGLVAAGDEAAVAIADICHSAGVELLPYAPDRQAFKPGQTIALAAIRRLVERRGPVRAREVLAACRLTDHAPISADTIKLFDALMCDPDYAGEIEPTAIAEVLASLGARAVAEARTLAITKHLQMWRATIAVVLKHRRSRPRTAEAALVPDGAPTSATPDVAAPRDAAPARRPTGAAARPLSLQARVLDRRPAGGVVPMGEPGPGRSALDQRRAGA